MHEEHIKEQLQLHLKYYEDLYNKAGVDKPEWLTKNQESEEPQRVGTFKTEKKDNTLNVVMDGPIDSLIGLDYRKIINVLDEHPDADINIRLSSPGGFLFQGLSLYGKLSDIAQKNKLTIRGQGLVGSAAAAMFLAAEPENRTLANGTMYFLHGTQGVLLAMGNKEQIRERAESIYNTMESTDKNLQEILASRTEISDENIKSWTEGEKFLTKKDAIDNGIATGDPQAEEGDKEGDSEEAKNELDDGMKYYLRLVYKQLGELENDR